MLKKLAGLLFYGRFARAFSVLGYRQAEKDFEPLESDFTNQIWLVTGASGGIGKAIALEANARGATVWAVARSETKLNEAKALATDPETFETQVCDLSSLNEIRALVDQWPEGDDNRLSVLVNNVGMLPHHYQETVEGFETALATNLLGPVLLTKTLTEQRRLRQDAVIINVSSGGMYGTPLRLLPMTEPSIDEYDGVSLYAQHKRAMVAWTHHWNKAHLRGPSMYVMHPGWVDTQGVQTSLPTFQKTLKGILRTPSQGADTVVWLADKRPSPPEAGIWLDRQNQPEHVFQLTRHSRNSVDELIDYLDTTLAPWL